MLGILRRPTQADVRYLAEHMSAADKAEVLAAGHLTPLAAVTHSVLASRDTWAWVVEDRVVCIYGIGADVFLESDEYHPWMLTTDDVQKYARFFLRGCRLNTKVWNRRYGRMTNWVDANHTRAVRWLKWLGFSVSDPIPLGHDGHPFCRFTMEAPNVAA